ncbi:NAD(+) diphosphatase [Microbacterium sp. cx-55]|uniref:NAD(+) diphosphatase n=1 Tax=unclassified Microbacterium TaxID=2609290 RepID=UPI001CBE02CD|nr:MULTISPECIES: NAD(+) diphosphatase [unclassified Microbacterium]MBZ4485921.1 NAD(+) diphosphatase [Microbacterium sp. cx-55]MCC4906882.1 NAD(+) diphosphatase [Microbacterium sp. cx-59]UGB34203.1 NAD(+) diphosphatase [Microbacterium sp. cx-55]
MTASGTTPPAFAGAGIDRAAEERVRPQILAELRANPSTLVLVVHGDRVPLAAPARLAFVRPEDVPGEPEWALLGRRDGAGVLAAVFGADAPEPALDVSDWAAVRVVGGELDTTDAAFAIEALSLGRWLLDAPFCPACGTRTHLEQAGWVRRCPHCGRQHFPRTDPAVIVAVTSAIDPDRLLLGSNAAWPAGRYSCFAGFVEAGESLEAAVARELVEEAGIDVVDVRYRGSQAWPYPRSLMLGFHAAAHDDDVARADGEEILEIRWFTRAEILEAFAGRGEFTLPGTASIAYRLILDWAESAA